MKIEKIPDGFILIGGHNARGKTSLYLSLGFVFAGTKGVYYQKRIRDLVNHNPEVTHAMVRITLRNKKSDGSTAFPGIPKDKVVIERVVGKKDNSSDVIKVNGEKYTPSDLRSILKQAHIEADNPYQFVAQGQLGTIITKTPSERLGLLDIFVPASETGQNFLDGLRQMRRADRSLQELRTKELLFEKEELSLREVRKRYENKIELEKLIKESSSLWAYVHKEEVKHERDSAIHDLSEVNRRIKELTHTLKHHNPELLSKKALLDNENNHIQTLKENEQNIRKKSKYLNNKKDSLLIEVSRYKQLKSELNDEDYISTTDAKNELEKAMKSRMSVEDTLNENIAEVKRIEKELNLLEKAELPALSIQEALNIAKREKIIAIYTFHGVEWATHDKKERKRLEMILAPIQNSITVETFNEAKTLMEKGIEIPIVVAHSNNATSHHFNVSGILSENRSALLDAIEQEWEQVSDKIETKYKRQILSTGLLLNLVTIEKREHVSFIGTEGIKAKQSNLKNSRMATQEIVSELKQKLDESINEETRRREIYEIANKYEEMNQLKQINNDQIEELERIAKEITSLENEQEELSNSLQSANDVRNGLNNEIKALQEKIDNLEKGISDNKKALPSLEKRSEETNKKYEWHANEYSIEIKDGELLVAKLENIGTSSGYRADITRRQKELDEIGEVPENAIEEHDMAKKRLERFSHQAEEQRNAANIDPQKVREDIQQYEQAIRRFVTNINVNLRDVMKEFNADARFIFHSPGLDEDNWEYKPGLKIRVKFKGKDEIEVEEHCSLSGGEKTRLVVALLVALIKSQERQFTLPFLALDEFDAQLDEPGHKQVMELLHREIGARQLIIFSPNRLTDKALVADMVLVFTNESEHNPEIKVMAVRENEGEYGVSKVPA